MNQNLKSGVANIILMLAAGLISLLIAEAVSRLIFNPIDYLLPILEEDSLLDYRIPPGAGGHDQWGFRNNAVPSTAELIAIGDSQTYGISAAAKESWPSLLSGEMDTTVYNLALGGYGPLHYLHLLKSKALQLQPKTIIAGLYFGNDFQDAYDLAYRNPNWKAYRNHDIQDKLVPPDNTDSVPEQVNDEQFLGSIRTWLASHSVIYRIVTQSIVGNIVREREADADNSKVKYKLNEKLTTYFNPLLRTPVLDPNAVNIQEGVRISMQVLKEMKEICVSKNVRMIVLLIPTKEMVYSAVVLNDSEFSDREIFNTQIKYETQLRKNVIAFLEGENIELLDVLPVLSQATQEKIIYPFNDDHPNGDGYSIIAKKVAAYLSQPQRD